MFGCRGAGPGAIATRRAILNDDVVELSMKSSIAWRQRACLFGNAPDGRGQPAILRRVADNWDAVARAINHRLRELGWNQGELVQRSHVSPAIVREIQRNTVNRKRSPRTLEALSTALGWHPDHLDAVLHGRQPPSPEKTVLSEGDLVGRMDAMEGRLDAISAKLDDLKADLATVLEHVRSGGAESPGER